jgi:hypothetical protein
MVLARAARRAPPLLLGGWPEDLHPASAEGLPSAEDLGPDRSAARRGRRAASRAAPRRGAAAGIT